MKFQVVFALMVSAMVVSAQIVPPLAGPLGVPGLPFVPPIFPPFLFPGFGLRPFFGLRRLALFGGLGFPFGGLGFGLGGLGFGGLLGKRDVEEVEKKDSDKADAIDKLVEKSVEQVMEMSKLEKAEAKKVEKSVETPVAEPRTLCSLSTEDNRLRCNGEGQSLECRVRPQIARLGSLKLRLADLVFRNQEDVIELVGRNSEITAVSPVDKSDILISLFNGERASLNGFEVEDRECWDQVRQFVKVARPENHRVSLFIQA